MSQRVKRAERHRRQQEREMRAIEAMRHFVDQADPRLERADQALALLDTFNALPIDDQRTPEQIARWGQARADIAAGNYERPRRA